MKKITLFFVAIVLLNSHATVAQSSGEDTDNNALNPAAMLDQLDMSEISTGILIDRSFYLVIMLSPLARLYRVSSIFHFNYCVVFVFIENKFLITILVQGCFNI